MNSSEAVSRYMLWRHHRQKPQPSPHTAPNDKRAGSLGEGEGLGGNTAKREEMEGGRVGRGINTMRGEERGEMLGEGGQIVDKIQAAGRQVRGALPCIHTPYPQISITHCSYQWNT